MNPKPRTSNPQPFVPADFDAGNFRNIEPLCTRLLERPLESSGDLRRWLLDLAELMEQVDECESRRRIDYACHTDDEEKERAYLHFVREVEPKLKSLFFRLQKRWLDCPHRAGLDEPSEMMIGRDWAADVEIFREANVPLQTQETERNTEYGKICGAMTVDFRGATLTLQQLARYLEEPDRDTRKEAWRLGAARRLHDRERIDAIFDELLVLRGQIAANADFENYRAFAWKAKKRFDYTPDDCTAFADAVEQHCLPLVEKLDGQRRAELGLETLRPWDLRVDPRSSPPLRPFDAPDVDGFVDRTRSIFARISPGLGEQFEQLRACGNLDLDSRRDKRPGGFQASLEASKQPFIFMNAAGLQRDVDTLLHEGGHAFHYQEARHRQILFARHAPLEFCEVASMSMELLGCDHYDAFYGADEPGRADAARAKRLQFEDIVRLLPWVATIDGYQHWLYTNPGRALADRTEAWLNILDRFSSRIVDWSGLEMERRSMWHRQLHLFGAPFYYIEYGIAQLGALQMWMNYRRRGDEALRDLRAAFALGGSCPLPQLFQTAGIRFDFSDRTVGPLMEELEEEVLRMME